MSAIDWTYWLAGDGVEARDMSGLYVVARHTKGYVVPQPHNAPDLDVVTIQWNGQRVPFHYTAKRLATDVRNISAERRIEAAASRERMREAAKLNPPVRFLVFIDGVMGGYERHSYSDAAREGARDAWLTNDPQNGDTLDVDVVGPDGTQRWQARCVGGGDEFEVEVILVSARP